MSYYNSFIETYNAYRLLGLSDEQTDTIINIDLGWNPQRLDCDLSYEDYILGYTFSRSSWAGEYSPMIQITKDMIDDMTANNTFHQFIFKNNTAICFRITGTPGNRLNFEQWIYNYITQTTDLSSSSALICTYEDFIQADDEWYVIPYVSDTVDSQNNPGWNYKDVGIAFTQAKGLAYLITSSPIRGARTDDGIFPYQLDPVKYYYYEYSNLFNESNWTSVPDWFWDGNEASVSVDYPGEDDEDDTGGYGDGEEWDDEVPFADVPTISALGTELVNIYTPDVSELQAFNTWLWSSGYEANVKKLQASPMENIIAFGFIPYTVTSVAETIKIGGIDTAITSKAASKQYIEVDCESVHVGKYYDSFLDYDAEYQIFLPFIGYKPLRVDDITGADIAVKYLVDILTGTCYAQVQITKYDDLVGRNISNVMYSYMGNCFIELPISGANYARMKQGQMASVVHGATSIASNVFKGASAGAAGGPAGAIGGAVAGAALSIPDIMTAKQNYDLQRPEYDHGGGLSGNALFTYKKPFIIRTKMVRNVPKNYKQYKGIPSSKFKYLKDLKGFTKINAVVVDTLTNLTAQEKNEIVSLLQEGVII